MTNDGHHGSDLKFSDTYDNIGVDAPFVPKNAERKFLSQCLSDLQCP